VISVAEKVVVVVFFFFGETLCPGVTQDHLKLGYVREEFLLFLAVISCWLISGGPVSSRK
jgi:hypothetical protein